MSTPNSHQPARGTLPNTPSPVRTNSLPYEPKSEYLRHALDAKRAKQASATPSPTVEAKPSQSHVLSKSSSDPWLDQAKKEEEVPQITPMRRQRRPSEGAMPRMRTQRELQDEAEKMKKTIWDLNMKLELIREQNNHLKDEVEEAHKRIEELESFEEENHELREINDRLTLKLQDVTDEAVELRDRNAEILVIQDESVANMEKQHAALEEAADIIVRIESEKGDLALENTQLKEQVASLQRRTTVDTYYATIDGSKEKYPSRVYSVDESRPSTSHFDSDYYSQPASPHVKASKDSLPDVTVSDRAKTFLAMNREGARSVQDLKKRLSDASMKMVKPKASIPEVPQIPESFQQVQAPKTTQRTPRRSKPVHTLSPALAIDPLAALSNTIAPTTPTSQVEGLRGMFREGMSLDSSARKPWSSSSYPKSPLESRGSKSSREVDPPKPPARLSSRHAQTSSSAEQLRSDQRLSVETDDQTDTSEWAELPPPPSVVSEDLTTELDIDRSDRWWKTLDKLHNSSGKQKSFFQASGMDSARPTTSRSASSGGPYVQKDFFFNATEDEDQFMKRANGYMPRRRDR